MRLQLPSPVPNVYNAMILRPTVLKHVQEQSVTSTLLSQAKATLPVMYTCPSRPKFSILCSMITRLFFFFFFEIMNWRFFNPIYGTAGTYIPLYTKYTYIYLYIRKTGVLFWGHILFSICAAAAPIIDLFLSYGLPYHSYADGVKFFIAAKAKRGIWCCESYWGLSSRSQGVDGH